MAPWCVVVEDCEVMVAAMIGSGALGLLLACVVIAVLRGRVVRFRARLLAGEFDVLEDEKPDAPAGVVLTDGLPSTQMSQHLTVSELPASAEVRPSEAVLPQIVGRQIEPSDDSSQAKGPTDGATTVLSTEVELDAKSELSTAQVSTEAANSAVVAAEATELSTAQSSTEAANSRVLGAEANSAEADVSESSCRNVDSFGANLLDPGEEAGLRIMDVIGDDIFSKRVRGSGAGRSRRGRETSAESPAHLDSMDGSCPDPEEAARLRVIGALGDDHFSKRTRESRKRGQRNCSRLSADSSAPAAAAADHASASSAHASLPRSAEEAVAFVAGSDDEDAPLAPPTARSECAAESYTSASTAQPPSASMTARTDVEDDEDGGRSFVEPS